jgi:excisionase family DNA binding protein
VKQTPKEERKTINNLKMKLVSYELAAMQQQLEQVNRKLDFLIQTIGRKTGVEDQPLNGQQAADYLHISSSHLYALIYEGKIKPIQKRKHGRILFTKELLNDYLKENQ